MVSKVTISSKAEIGSCQKKQAIVTGGGVEDLRNGRQIAAESIDSGKAKPSLKKLIEVTQGSG